MSLVDFFRPKWKHSDASIRADAVRAMGPDDEPRLVKIALEDADDRVREIAIKRIGNPDTLLELASGQPDEVLAELASGRAGEILVGSAVQSDDPDVAHAAVSRISDPTTLAEVVKRASLDRVRLSALSRLDDDKALAEVARGAKLAHTRVSAVERITDQAVLRGIAQEGGSKEVALAAVGKLEDVECLESVTKNAKVKAARSKAQKKLGELRSDEPADDRTPSAEVRKAAKKKRDAARRRTRAVKACDRIEDLLSLAEDPETHDRLSELEGRWIDIMDSGAIDEELEKRFADAREKLRERLDAVEARQAQERKERAAAKVAVDARKSLVERVEALDGDDAEAALEPLEVEWKALEAAEGREVAALERRFTAAARKIKSRKENEERRAAARPELEKIVEEAETLLDKPLKDVGKSMGALRRQWREVLSGIDADEDLAERLESVSSRLREREAAERETRERERKEAFEAFEEVISRMESFGEEKDLRVADSLLREGRDLAKKANSDLGRRAWQDLRPRFKDADRALARKVSELREADEWNRHFNVRRQEELCVRVEKLRELEDKAEAAKELKAAQQEWRKVSKGPKGRSDELWQRFKKAGDAVYEKCEGYFEGMKVEREQNLDKKRALAEEAESLAESTDFKTTAERLKAIQMEWKEIGPVRRRDSDVLWKRLRSACDTFFGRRKEHFKELDEERGGNLEKKNALCDRAEELQDSSEWDETANALKGLQAEWKSIGPVPRRNSDAIWKRFRAACDRFFARREAHLDGGRRENLEKKTAMCEELEKALEGGDDAPAASDLASRTLEIWREWPEVGAIPFDEVERMQARLETLCSKVVEAHPEPFAGTELDPEAAAQKREKLVERAETLAERLASKGSADDEEEEDLSVAERLQEAMARNTYKKEAREEGKQQGQDEAVRVRRSWASCPPVPGEAGAKLAERFGAAIAKVERVTGKLPDAAPAPALED